MEDTCSSCPFICNQSIRFLLFQSTERAIIHFHLFVNIVLKASAGFYTQFLCYEYSTSHFITLTEREHPSAHRSLRLTTGNLYNNAPLNGTRVRLRLSDRDLQFKPPEKGQTSY